MKLYLVAVAYTLSVGFSFFGIKKCVLYADTLTILFYRYAAALMGVVIWFGVSRAMGRTPRKKMNRPKRKLYQTSALYVLFMIFQILAMFFATSVEGAIVFAMVPIFAKLIGRIVLEEKATRLQNIFVTVTVASLIILILLNATNIELNVTGLLLMTVSTVLFACQNVSTRYIRGVFKPIEITRCIAASGFILFAAASLGRTAIRGEIIWLFEPLYHREFIGWVSYLGVFCLLISAQFMAYMLAHMQIVQSTIFNSASTLVSILAGVLILKESFYWYHYICGGLILIGVIGMSLVPAKAENSGKSLEDDMRNKFTVTEKNKKVI